MPSYLYPRIDAPEAERLMRLVLPLTIEQARAESVKLRDEARVSFAAVGAPRVPATHLGELADKLRGIAAAHGYPARRDLRDQQEFDTDASMLLHDELSAVPGEARRNETWQYLTCALVPDLVLWRWRDRKELSTGGVTRDRYLGGRRNCLGRLWLRADVFRDPQLEDGWRLVRSLSEDNFTAILERANVARYREMCRVIAGEYLASRDRVAKLEDSPEQRLLRQLMLRVTRTSGHTAFGVLDRVALTRLVGHLADQTLEAMGVARPAADRAPGAVIVSAGAAPQVPARVEPLHPRRAEPGARSREEFLSLRVDDQIRAVWEAVLGEGALLVPDLVRIAAENLRRRGQVSYQRLREDGPLYRRLQDVIGWGQRKGFFDAPSRGKRRAVARSGKDVPRWLWHRVLRSVLAADRPLAGPDVTRELQLQLASTLGCELTPKAIRTVLAELEAQGLISADADGQLLAGPQLIDEDPWWPEAA